MPPKSTATEVDSDGQSDKGADDKTAKPVPQSKKSVLSKGDVGEAEEAPKKRERVYVPLTFFYIKDLLREFVNNKYFPDSVLSVFAMLSVAIAFPFYPLAILIPLLVIVFVLSRLHPLAGLMGLLFLTFPMFVYQTPLLAWLYLVMVSLALFMGYRRTDTITVSYALIMLPFSYLGYFIEIPAFIMSILFLGFRRGLLVAAITLLVIPMVSGITGIHNTAPIIYNEAAFRSIVSNNPVLPLLTPSSVLPSLSSFPSSFSSAFARFFDFSVSGKIFQGAGVALSALVYNIQITLFQLVLWLLVVFCVSNYAVKSRSPYKGTAASLFSFVILAGFFSLQLAGGNSVPLYIYLGFVLTPLSIFFLEVNDVKIVRALDVMKRDFISKFGDAFEELVSGTHETLDDVADYAETKKELTEAILEPIEHREIAGAYNIKPAKGILLFGPPGTGKTLIMRALSNEVRARFFYVKTSSLVSPYAGESLQMLSKIFTMVKKNAPAVLFFDEIDGIAGKRESQTEESRQLLSMLLAEMDGFQKLEGIVVVGSTNVPNLLDPAMMRPGRFDKIIYMPLPDRNARAEVFKYYSRMYPMAEDLDVGKLADMTERFSNADIANVCSEAARHVAEMALKEVKVLKINTDDLARVIKSTKPSISLSRIAEYERFRIDYERRMYKESVEENKKKVSVEDVVGLEDAKKVLYEALEIPILHPGLAKEYDVKSINGILLFGPPGTGKTMMMKAVQNEIGDYRMITLSGADVIKEGYDKAVDTIKEAFDRAKENAPSIIFIDEVDSLVPKRDSGERIDIQITAEFLREFDSLKDVEGVVLVGSTNRPDAIDAAMIRPGRFDKLVFVGPPDKEARALLFEKELSKAPHEQNIDFDKLAGMTQGYTGADIANICREVKMRALKNKISSSGEENVTTDEIVKIIKATKPSVPPGVLGRYTTFLSIYGRD